MAQTLSTRPVSPALGVEILDIDLRAPLSSAAEEALRRLFDDAQLLLFRNQSLTPDDQIRVTGIFGTVSDETGDGTKHGYVSNFRPDGLFGEQPLPWHQDFAFRPYFPEAFSLYADEVAGASVPTLFANAVRAARTLPASLRDRIANRTLVNAEEFTQDLAGTVDRQTGFRRPRLQELAEIPSEFTHPRTSFPILRTHPRSSQVMLTANEMHTSHIEGLSHADSEALLAELFATQYAPDNTYAHHWRQGDLVIWDNLALHHARRFPDGTGEQARRSLRRVVVSDMTARQLLAGTAYNRPSGFTGVNAQG